MRRKDEYSKREDETYVEYMYRQPFGGIEKETTYMVYCPHCTQAIEAEEGRLRHLPDEVGQAGEPLQCNWCYSTLLTPEKE